MKLDMVKSHIEYVTLHLYRTQIEKQQFKDPRIKPIMMDIYRIDALRSLVENSSPCFQAEFFVPIAC